MKLLVQCNIVLIMIDCQGPPMRIEFEDRDVIVIYKEAGLPVQAGRTSRKDVVSLLKNHLAMAGMPEPLPADVKGSTGMPEPLSADVKDSTGGKRNYGLREVSHKRGAHSPAGGAAGMRSGEYKEPYLGIVHRLDQPVEGLLVFARTPKSAAALSAQAASKSGMEKVYQAVVCLNSSSYPLAVEGMKREVTLTDWLGRDRSSNTAYIAAEGERDAKRAELVFRTVWIREGHALLEIRLHTGRHHQIRVQMAHAGMPLLGDRKYQDPDMPGGRSGYNCAEYKTGSDGLRERGSAARNEGSYDSGEMRDVEIKDFNEKIPLCLCAAKLSFTHPVSKRVMTFSVTPSWLPLVSKDANMCT